MRSKRQTTMAKMNRERAVKERRERKREKKQAAAAARNATPDESAPAAPSGENETSSD